MSKSEEHRLEVQRLLSKEEETACRHAANMIETHLLNAGRIVDKYNPKMSSLQRADTVLRLVQLISEEYQCSIRIIALDKVMEEKAEEKIEVA